VLGDHPGAVDTDARAKQVASSRAWASVTDRAPTIAGSLALCAVAEIAVMLLWYLVDKTVFESLPRRSAAITNVSAFIASALAAGLVTLTVLAYRSRELRRVVAVLWDVVTFWPRANHPLTPPCYAERTVPELLDRLMTLTRGNGRVVLAAHSQGSLIAAATLLQAGDVDRVALLTFGSPLRRLYARMFPAYFGTRALPRLRARQRQRWIDLWACSDPIGGWVFDDKNLSIEVALRDVDCRLYDVQGLSMRPDGTYPPICGHSGFWTRPEYREAMTALAPADSETDMSANVSPTKEMM
jgi:hypothetical protein